MKGKRGKPLALDSGGLNVFNICDQNVHIGTVAVCKAVQQE
jgi:hypothetical protein